MKYYLICLSLILAGCNSFHLVSKNRATKKSAEKTSEKTTVQSTKTTPTPEPAEEPEEELAFDQEFLKDFCMREMVFFPGPYDKEKLELACSKVKAYDECRSVNGDPIMHYDREGESKNSKRVLALSMIHGDEIPAGSVSRNWMARLEGIDPRNHWRVLPLANPDGVKLRTRMNANKVDLNRNFPSEDWDDLALKYWKTKKKSDPRRYPGPSGASEIETRCIMKHLEEFKPDFVISVHTPLGVLDFDGPKVRNPNFKPLPWVGLGNFPGSLGRYMWVDRKVPVLTIELKGSSGLKKLEEFDRLQDVTGTIAIQADKVLKIMHDNDHD